jgi:hypothetical protein
MIARVATLLALNKKGINNGIYSLLEKRKGS